MFQLAVDNFKVTSLREAIELLCGPQRLEDYRCDTCRKRDNVEGLVEVISWGSILRFHFKIFINGTSSTG